MKEGLVKVCPELQEMMVFYRILCKSRLTDSAKTGGDWDSLNTKNKCIENDIEKQNKK